MLNFTPLESTAGGALIGLSATTLLLGNGDILGCSGIVSSLVLKPMEAISNPQNKWKLVFLSSFLVTSNLYHIFILEGDASVHKVPEEGSIRVINDLAYVVGGFLVGIGTRLGNGCTSGHGICGLARFSKRSFAAVMTFMATGIGMASFVADKDVFSSASNDLTWVPNEISKQVSSSVVALFATSAASVLAKSCVKTRPSSDTKKSTENDERQRKIGLKKSIIGAVAGSLFSAGLALSGMIKQYKVLGFLNLSDISKWDPSLMFVMGGGLIISFGGYQFVKGHGIFRKEKALTCPPLLGDQCKFNVPTNTKIDKQLILGSAMFGMGWGIAGLCPGPALFSFATGFPKVMMLWWPSNLVGTVIGEQAKKLF
ncbi:hypothetical protein CTEN210_18179 [Chaetoceros tenuissimus]|uniref:Sulphur transport domain-containing protein n=1 Tax=Chaetoceros tenuissimus TaxID=426638 RepID=A0AAD3DC75_9STRA|nr:hypothetical protein CTEN210_18179 [Chaetoceros tenuissimus]